jgi:hypothetical protein
MDAQRNLRIMESQDKTSQGNRCMCWDLNTAAAEFQSLGCSVWPEDNTGSRNEMTTVGDKKRATDASFRLETLVSCSQG